MRNENLQDRNQELGKLADDQNQNLNVLRLESDGLKSQLRVMNEQYKDLLGDNDRLKGEVLRSKGNYLDVENEWKSSKIALERMTVEFRQIKEALKKTEFALEVHNL